MTRYINFLESKSRFRTWLVVFFVVLMIIPALLLFKQTFFAKATGFILIVLINVALWRWRTQTIKKIEKASRIKMTLNERFWLNRHISFYTSLSKTDKKIFEDRIGLFLADVRITEIGREVTEKEVCLYVASSAIIAFWGLPYWSYGELSEVLVYSEDMNEENNVSLMNDRKLEHGQFIGTAMAVSLQAVVKDLESLSDNSSIWFELLKIEIEKNKTSGTGLNEIEFLTVIDDFYENNPESMKQHYPLLFKYLDDLSVAKH